MLNRTELQNHTYTKRPRKQKNNNKAKMLLVLPVVLFIAFVSTLSRLSSLLPVEIATAAERLPKTIRSTFAGKFPRRDEEINHHQYYYTNEYYNLDADPVVINIGMRRSFRTVDILNTQSSIELRNNTRQRQANEKEKTAKSTVTDTDTSSGDDSNSNYTDDDDDDDDDDVQELYFTQVLDHYHDDTTRQQQQQQQQQHVNTSTGTGETNIRTFQQRYFRSDRFNNNNKNLRSSSSSSSSSSSNTNVDDDATATTTTTVVLICVGGEGPALDKSVLRDSVHCTGDMMESAQQLQTEHPLSSNINIVLIALEHRYYGSSYPVFVNEQTNETESPVTNENLVYLSSRQATADLAHFIRTMFHTNHNHSDRNSNSNSNSNSNAATDCVLVYLFGGSYPGMVAAFTRAKYPYLIQGVVSNSAPVQAVLNFDTYQSHVGYNLKQIDINCYNVVSMGHLAITKLLRKQNNTLDLQSLAEQFQLCHPDTVLFNKDNQNLFVGDGVMYFGAQENDPHCNSSSSSDGNNYCNMEQKCNALTTQYTKEMMNDTATIETAAINALSYLARIQQQQQRELGRITNSLLSSDDDDDVTVDHGTSDDGDCFVVDWNETVNYISDPILGQTDGLRSWLYQTCTEFGFYQTCQDTKCPFGIGYHLLSQDVSICQSAFQIYDTIQAVQATNEWTGGWKNIQQTSRILSVTGSVDPWSEMAIQHTSAASFHRHNNNTLDYPTPYQVIGASHHFWTHPSADTDDDAIVAARLHIYQKLHDWIVYDIDMLNSKRIIVPS